MSKVSSSFVSVILTVSCLLAIIINGIQGQNAPTRHIDFMNIGMRVTLNSKTNSPYSQFNVTMRADNPVFASPSEDWYMSVGLNQEAKMSNANAVMCRRSGIRHFTLSSARVPLLLSDMQPSLGLANSTIMEKDGNVTCCFMRRNEYQSNDDYYQFTNETQPAYFIAAFGTSGYHGANRATSFPDTYAGPAQIKVNYGNDTLSTDSMAPSMQVGVFERLVNFLNSIFKVISSFFF